jgi:hypothetical protein
MYGRLFALRCANGAYACACAAIEALVSVDYILAVLLGDCANRAFACASAATDAFICVDLVSHG